MRIATYSLISILLAGCDGGNDAAPPPQVRKIEVADSGGSVARLRSLSDQNRNLALRRAIQDSGNSCRRIEKSDEIGTHQNMVMWAARCDQGRSWAIFIAPAGDVQVRSCVHVAQLGLPTCETGKPAVSRTAAS